MWTKGRGKGEGGMQSIDTGRKKRTRANSLESPPPCELDMTTVVDKRQMCDGWGCVPCVESEGLCG
jgi:hypothetical protein